MTDILGNQLNFNLALLAPELALAATAILVAYVAVAVVLAAWLLVRRDA